MFFYKFYVTHAEPREMFTVMD